MIFLLGNALWDIRTRCIHLGFTLVFAGLGVWMTFSSSRTAGEVILSLTPGIFLFLASMLSRGAIGGGDGIALAVLGIYLDLTEVLQIACIAFAGAAVAAFILFLTKRRNEAYPFLPFLFLGGLAARLLL